MISTAWLLIGIINSTTIVDTHQRFPTKKACLIKKKTAHIHQSVDLLNREPTFECVRMITNE
jgi:hypothetical protein